MENTAVMGVTCVMVAMVVPLPEKTVLPGSTRRSPMRPVSGATIW